MVLFEDEIREIAKEIICNHAEDRVKIGLDYFDASINRIGAWAIGARSMQKALLYACLLPHEQMKKLQDEQNFTKLMNLQEECKTLPFHEIWEEYTTRQGVKGDNWFEDVEKYEKDVLSRRV